MKPLKIKHAIKKDSNILFFNNTGNGDNTIYKCSCGFSEQTTSELTCCPNCNTKKTYNSKIIKSNKVSFINKMEATKEKFYLEYVVFKAIHEDNDFIIDKEVIEVIMEDLPNDKGRVVLTPKLLINEIEHEWRKSDLIKLFSDYRYCDRTPDTIKVDLYKFAHDFVYSNIGENIWNIYNKYKYCRDLLNDSTFNIYGSLKDIKESNKIYKNLKTNYKEYLDLVDSIVRKSLYSNSYCIAIDCHYYRALNFNAMFENVDKKFFEYEKNKLTIEQQIKDRLEEIEDYVGRRETMVIDLLQETSIDLDTVLNLFNIANRQEYGLKVYSKLRTLIYAYKFMHQAGLPLDWKPKELEIYVKKSSELSDMCNNSYHINNRQIEKGKYEFPDTYELAKHIYDLGGFELIDKVLYDYNMEYRLRNKISYVNKNKLALLSIKDKNNELPFIALYSIHFPNVVSKVTLHKVYTKDLEIEGHDNCKLYLENLIEELNNETKGELICKAIS